MRARSVLVPLSVMWCCHGCSNDHPVPVESTSQPVLNGKDDKDSDRTIMMTRRVVDGGSAIATATVVKYPRCFVTAAHVNPDNVWAGADLTDLKGKKTQDVAKKKPRPDAVDPWRDLQVLWVENKKSTEEIPRLDEMTDYLPAAITDSTALETIQLEKEGELDISGGFSKGGPIPVMIFGYGQNKEGAGDGIRRSGVVMATHYVQGSVQKKIAPRIGSFYVLQQTQQTKQMGCPGDSGGPVVTFDGDKKALVFAVYSTAKKGAKCTEDSDTDGVATGFDKGTVGDGKSNWDFLQDTFALHCGKEVNFFPGCGGKVVLVSLTPGQERTIDPEVNGKIHCGDVCTSEAADCVEVVHFGQTLKVEAIAEAGYRFKKWSTKTNCPCAGDTSAVCALPYAKIGQYDATTSIDDSDCIAEFESTTPGPVPVCCPDTGLCMMCATVPDLAL